MNTKTISSNYSTFFNFRIPLSNGDIRSAWIKEIEKHQKFNQTSAYYAVCSLHFNQNDIDYTGQKPKLRDGAYPSIFKDSNRYYQ